MVVLTQILCVSRKFLKRIEKQGIVDSLRLYVKGGTGGSGLPKYGGKGGNGGNVYVVSEEGATLKHLKTKLTGKKLSAAPGLSSSAKGILGLAGENLVIKVPNGISVYTDAGLKLGEVNKVGEQLLVAKGGMGGCQETGYCGMKGESHAIRLDLRLIADVGLIGFPNAGKSTLLNVISRARPKIANYPFTTLAPHLGTLDYADGRKITVADLPGLIEGAHMNHGLGHRFLKHVERTKLLLFVSDIQGFQFSIKHFKRSCIETILLLNKEIEMYKPDLLDMPAMLLINKMDTQGADKIYEEILPKLKNLSEHVDEVAEDSRPERALEFMDIMSTSLVFKDKEHLQSVSSEIRERIRNVVDKSALTVSASTDFDLAEERLKEKLERHLQRTAPPLV